MLICIIMFKFVDQLGCFNNIYFIIYIKSHVPNCIFCLHFVAFFENDCNVESF